MVFEIILGFVALLLAIGGIAMLNRVGGGSRPNTLISGVSEEASVAGAIQEKLMRYMRSLYSDKDPTSLVYRANYFKKLFERYAPITGKLLERMKSTIETSIKKYKPLEESLLRMYSCVNDVAAHAYARLIGAIPPDDAANKIRRALGYHLNGMKVAEDITDTKTKIGSAVQETKEKLGGSEQLEKTTFPPIEE